MIVQPAAWVSVTHWQKKRSPGGGGREPHLFSLSLFLPLWTRKYALLPAAATHPPAAPTPAGCWHSLPSKLQQQSTALQGDSGTDGRTAVEERRGRPRAPQLPSVPSRLPTAPKVPGLRLSISSPSSTAPDTPPLPSTHSLPFISLPSCTKRTAAMGSCMIYEALFLPVTEEKERTERKRKRDSQNEGAGPKEGGRRMKGPPGGRWGCRGGVWRGAGRCEGDIHHPPTPRLQTQTGSRNQVTGGAAGLNWLTSAWFIVNLTAHISLGNNFISIRRFISATL